MEHRRKKKGSSKLLIIMVIVLALLAIAAIFALKFYTDINNPENLFESTLPEGTPAPVETAPAPADEEAQPSPTPDQESLLSGQADAEFMSNRTNILLLGIDESTERENWGTFRTDTMILVSIDFSNNDVCMVSIPRDSYVKIYNANGNVANPSSPYSKINNAFSEGGGAQKKGFEYSIATVEKLMGVNIGYYCGFNMNVVKEVVNAMGGVDYDVDIEVKMNGRELHPGMQHLDGQGVLDYCRQRKGSSDTARADRQQRMLFAIFTQLREGSRLTSIPKLYLSVKDYIYTDLTAEQIAALAVFGMDLVPGESLVRHTLKGKYISGTAYNGASFYVLDTRALKSLMKDIFGVDIKVDYRYDYRYIQDKKS